MNEPASNRPVCNLLIPAVVLEGGLVVLAVVLGWLLGKPVLAAILWQPRDALLGTAASLLPLALVALAVRFPIGPLADLVDLVDAMLVPLFRDCRVIDLAVIAILAGLGEEMLFRAILQQSIADLVGGTTGVWAGLIGSAVLFAVAHWISHTYALLAGLIGLYFGWLWLATGNLLVPIVGHAVYDFVILVYLVRFRTAGPNGED